MRSRNSPFNHKVVAGELSSAPSGRLLVTKKEAATALCISERTLFTLTKKGIVPVVRLKNSVRYHLPTVEKAVLALQSPPMAEKATSSPPSAIEEVPHG